MSIETDPKKQGLLYWLGISIMLVLLLILCAVPFAVMGIALQRSGVFKFGHSTVSEKKAQISQEPDLSALRAVAEKAASTILPTPKKDTFNTPLLEFKITVPENNLQKTREQVLEVLKKNRQQYLESEAPNAIHLIITMSGNSWNTMRGELVGMWQRDELSLNEPKNGLPPGSSETVVAEIMIIKQ